MVFDVIINLEDKSEVITEKDIIQAHKDEGTHITKKIILPSDRNYAAIPTKAGVPTFISNDKSLLEAFMEGKQKL